MPVSSTDPMTCAFEMSVPMIHNGIPTIEMSQPQLFYHRNTAVLAQLATNANANPSLSILDSLLQPLSNLLANSLEASLYFRVRKESLPEWLVQPSLTSADVPWRIWQITDIN